MGAHVSRYHVFVPHISLEESNILAAQMDPDTGGSLTFSNDCCFSPTGNEPATYCACSTMMTQNSIDQLPGMKSQIGGSEYFEDPECSPSQDAKTFDEACDSMGLIRITENMEV